MSYLYIEYPYVLLLSRLVAHVARGMEGKRMDPVAALALCETFVSQPFASLPLPMYFASLSTSAKAKADKVKAQVSATAHDLNEVAIQKTHSLSEAAVEKTHTGQSKPSWLIWPLLQV